MTVIRVSMVPTLAEKAQLGTEICVCSHNMEHGTGSHPSFCTPDFTGSGLFLPLTLWH